MATHACRAGERYSAPGAPDMALMRALSWAAVPISTPWTTEVWRHSSWCTQAQPCGEVGALVRGLVVRGSLMQVPAGGTVERAEAFHR